MIDSPDPALQAQQAERLSLFLFASPTPFHAVENMKVKLQQAGFQQLHEADSWAGLHNAQVHEGFFVCAVAV